LSSLPDPDIHFVHFAQNDITHRSMDHFLPRSRLRSNCCTGGSGNEFIVWPADYSYINSRMEAKYASLKKSVQNSRFRPDIKQARLLLAHVVAMQYVRVPADGRLASLPFCPWICSVRWAHIEGKPQGACGARWW
jgi:hypothetical protein